MSQISNSLRTRARSPHGLGARDEGEHRAALDLLNRAMEPRFGVDVLGSVDRWVELAGDRRQSLLHQILTDPSILNAPPADVAAFLWCQAPCDTMLSALALADLRWSNDPFEQAENVPGAAELSALLRRHESIGLISRDTAEFPYGGRPVLGPSLIAVGDRPRLGQVLEAMECRSRAQRAQRTGGATPRNTYRGSFCAPSSETPSSRSRGEAGRLRTPGSSSPRNTRRTRRRSDPAGSGSTMTRQKEWRDATRFVARRPAPVVRGALEELLN